MANDDNITLVGDVIEKALKCGADAADVVYFQNNSLSVAQRLGKPEAIDRSEAKDLGLRVFIGARNASISTTDLKASTLDQVIERVISMAKESPEDKYAGIAPNDLIAREFQNIETFDPTEPSPSELTERAGLAEEAALAVNGINNSEGAEASWSQTTVALGISNGFIGSYKKSSHSVSAVVLAGEGQNMERDYDYSSCCFAEDLEAQRCGKNCWRKSCKEA